MSSASPAGRPMFVTKPVVPDRKIRFALAGCGRISANHFEAIAAHSAECELVGVCDVDPAALKAAEEKTGAPGFRSLEQMLAGDRCRLRHPGDAERTSRRAGDPGRGGRAACHDREADGDALAGRQAHGRRV